MATEAERAEARKLIEEGSRLAEEGATKLNEASKLLGSPKFRQQHARPSEDLHDLRGHAQKLDAYARSDIYHEGGPVNE